MSRPWSPPKVCVRLQYPDRIGPVTSEMLQNLLDKLRTDSPNPDPELRMYDLQWTLGARIISNPSSHSHGTATIPTHQQNGEFFQNGEYFCVTSPVAQPQQPLEWPYAVTANDTPTIITEMYHNIPGEGEALGKRIKGIITKIHQRLQECLCAGKEHIWIVIQPYSMEIQTSCCRGCKKKENS